MGGGGGGGVEMTRIKAVLSSSGLELELSLAKTTSNLRNRRNRINHDGIIFDLGVSFPLFC